MLKVYLINMERSVVRRRRTVRMLEDIGLEFEIIIGVDGQILPEAFIDKVVDQDHYRKNKKWFTEGMVGATLSHKKVYEKMIADNVDAALVLEDDIVLDEDVVSLLPTLTKNLVDHEVILLYYQSFSEIPISSFDSVVLSDSRTLRYPVTFDGLFSAAAYVLNLTTAIRLEREMMPIRIPPDGWFDYYKEDMIGSVRVVHPAPAYIAGDKSTILTEGRGRIREWLSTIVENTDLPFIAEYFRNRRRLALEATTKVYLSNDKPIQIHNSMSK